MGFDAHILGNGRVGCGALISLFLDFTAPCYPTQNGLNRKHPGATNKIQVDTLPRRIATSKIASWCSKKLYFPRECGNKSLY